MNPDPVGAERACIGFLLVVIATLLFISGLIFYVASLVIEPIGDPKLVQNKLRIELQRK